MKYFYSIAYGLLITSGIYLFTQQHHILGIITSIVGIICLCVWKRITFTIILTSLITIALASAFLFTAPLSGYIGQINLGLRGCTIPPSSPITPITPSPGESAITPTPLPPENSPPPLQEPQIEMGLFSLINQERTVNGLQKLTWAGNLYDKAKDHSNYMATTRVFVYPEYTQYYANIYMGNAYTEGPARMVFNTWMASPRNSSNFLRSQISRCGIGMVKSSTTMYVTWIAE